MLARENGVVSSTTTFKLDVRPSINSLMYIRNRRCPKFKHWEHLQFHLFKKIKPFSVIRMLKIFCKFNSSLTEIPFFGSLNIRLSSWTVWNPFKMSNITPKTSKPTLNEFYISSWAMGKSWLTQESPCLRPH